MNSAVSNVLAVTATILTIYLVKKYIGWRIYVNKINQIPGPKEIWPFGLAMPFIFGKEEDFMELYENIVTEYFRDKEGTKERSLVRIWIFNMPYIGVTSAKSAEILLKSTSELTKSDDYTFLHRWLGLGLLTSEGSKWRAHRKMLTPSFHFQILENFVPIFNEQSQILVEQLASQADTNKTFDVCSYVSRCALDIICDSAMGKKLHAQTQSDSEYVNAVIVLLEIIFKKFIYIWRKIPIIYFFYRDKRIEERCLNIVQGFTTSVIRERQEERAQQKKAPPVDDNTNDGGVYGEKRRMALLDALLEAIEKGEGYMSDEEIREEVDTFMLEGHHTMSSALISTIMNLANHPDIQDKVYEEIVSIFGNSDRPVESADMVKLKYMEAVLKEVLRLHPPVPFYGRTLLEDLVIEGYTIPKGTKTIISPRDVHRDPTIYTNPQDFDPSRFYKENSDASKHPYSFLAFSAGPRNCIGQRFAMMEEKVMITYLLRNYRISGTWTEKEAKMSVAFVSRPMRGLQVALTKRERH